MPTWLKEAPDHVILTLHVQPGARSTEVVGTHGAALKVRLAAPPVDGKANEMLIAFLAEMFAVPLRNVTIEAGHTGRSKRVRIVGPKNRPDQEWSGLA